MVGQSRGYCTALGENQELAGGQEGGSSRCGSPVTEKVNWQLAERV